ncbi:MAG: HDOD domain-containing protein [Nitrosomonadales bacterium]|nr:HDOD domain-containing protein [Nitrosomonadales bacterium]
MNLVDQGRYAKLKASGQLPSPKGIAWAIVELLQQDDYKTKDLVRLVQSDPVIAGELLKFSNAASYGRSTPIASIPEAITVLGTLRIRVLVVALSVLNNHRDGECRQFDYGRFWSRALATGIAAQALASFVKINADENFTAGLLSSLGELALASIFPERYGEIIAMSDDRRSQRLALEHKAFGFDHRELNATLMLEWGLPLEMISAIFYSEYPDEASFQEGSRIHGLTIALHVALALSDICVADDESRSGMLPDLYTKAARLGISVDEMNTMADEIISTWQEWGEFLQIQTRRIAPIGDIFISSPPDNLAGFVC